MNNIEYRNLLLKDINEIVKLWNENIEQYKRFKEEDFINHIILHPDFNLDGAFIATDNQKIVGLAIAIIRSIDENDPNKPGYLTVLLVDKNYRRKKIGTTLLKQMEKYVKNCNKNKLKISYQSTLNFPWYIPNKINYEHPGAPGVFINSSLYLFLINNGYSVIDEQDAFCLELANYFTPVSIKEKIKNNEKDLYFIELYDENKHYGIEEFFQDINDEAFIRVIKENLKKEYPNPFLVISKNNKILGWTGAMYTEESGRAHFDGIAISNTIRNRGLGEGLWCKLAQYSKEHNSKYMTFFTGRTNNARFIYLKTGFKIIQSFAIMERNI